MAQQKRKSGKSSGSKNKETKSQIVSGQPEQRSVKDDIWAILIIALGAFLVLAFQTHAAGAVGTALSDFFKGCFGVIAFALPYYLIAYSLLLFSRRTIHIGGKSVILLSIIFLMISLINAARFIDPKSLDFTFSGLSLYYSAGIDLESGGAFGMYIGSLLVKALGVPGLYIFAVVVILIALLLIINTPISRFFERISQKRKARQEEEQWDEEEELPTSPRTRHSRTQKLDKEELQYRNSAKKEEKKQGVQQAMDLQNNYNLQNALPETIKQIDPYETNYVPGRISSGQQNIIEYMKDDTLFGTSPEPESEAESDDIFSDFNLDDDGFSSINEKEDDSFLEKKTKEKDDIAIAAYDHDSTLSDDDSLSHKKKLSKKEAAQAALSSSDFESKQVTNYTYQLPPIDLLNKAEGASKKIGVDNSLKNKAMKLEETLQNFHIDAKVIQVTQGPAVTRYEIQPNVGVKVKSIVNLSDDIALNLEAKSIRIEAPIPGKAAIGIEVENDKVNMVTLREIIGSKEFKTAKSKITFAVGKDISGNAITADLKAMPHLLIAGSTGSGKSVCVNSIIASILYKAKPEEVKLVLIDPKVVELANYNGIPHLLIPVVTEPAKAAAALNWAVAEMDERYKKFAEEGVRELQSYNNTVKKDGEPDKAMPQVVIIIDELADLMMAAPSQVEESICRLAQKARAAGMHLIVATQRPSVDIITGVIKANIPSRIAFAVSSQFDSRTILDMAGAEKLVGKGDMLFNPMGGGKPHRVQGTFISDSEVHDIIEFVKSQVEEAEYADDVLDTIERANTPEKDRDEGDALLADAIETVVSAGSASVSMLQRRFRVGYNRAARMIDMMENRGIVGPSEGSKPRQVLMTEAELYALQNQTEGMEEEI